MQLHYEKEAGSFPAQVSVWGWQEVATLRAAGSWCFEVVVLGSAPRYWVVTSLNWFTAFIRYGMSRMP